MKIGAAAALALAVTRSIDRKVFAQAVASAPSFQKITARDAGVIAAIAPVVLAGNLPLDFASRQAAIAEVVAAFDRTVAGLPTAMQAEVDELLSLLGFGLTRRFIAGIAKPWPKAGEAEVRAFLNNWRHSRFATLQQGYQALVRALIACWYGSPRSWVSIGYSGPPYAKELGAL
ncbi:MAG TPA: hypothetical protein VF928_05175 [Usitatibacteraceae bacterium]